MLSNFIYFTGWPVATVFTAGSVLCTILYLQRYQPFYERKFFNSEEFISSADVEIENILEIVSLT